MSFPPGPPSPGQPYGPPPGWPAPGSPADIAPSGEPVLVSIGDITVTPTRVYTPSGSRPLSELQWSFTDLTVTSQMIPTWAIVCAVVFFLFCLLGLLFLLAKESVTQGYVQVSVTGPGFAHATQIPVASLAQVVDINARVNYVRTLAAALPPPGLGDQPPPGPGLPGPGQAWPQHP